MLATVTCVTTVTTRIPPVSNAVHYGETDSPSTPRAKTPSAISNTAWGSTISRRDASQPNAAWLAVQVMAYNLARWTTRIGLGEPAATIETLRRRFFSLAGRFTRKARRLILHVPQGWPWQNQFSSALPRLRALPLPS